MMKLLAILLLNLTTLSFGALNNVDAQFVEQKNIIKNPGFEYGKSFWSASGGTFNLNTTAANIGSGGASGAWTPSANGQTLGSSLVTLPAGIFGKQCIGKINYKGGANTLNVKILDGSGSQLAGGSLVAATNFQTASYGFPCPTSGSVKVQLAATASTAITYVDDVFVGESYPTGGSSLVLWRVDANISGADVDLGTASQGAYVGMTNASLAMVQNSGSLDVQIPCSTTNGSTGLTCAVGSESLGVVYTQPEAGFVVACATFSYEGQVNNGAVRTAFQIVETPNAAQTITTEGKGIAGGGLSTTQNMIVRNGERVCGTFNFSAGQKTLRLFYEQESSGSVTSSTILASDGSGSNRRDVHWEVYPIH